MKVLPIQNQNYSPKFGEIEIVGPGYDPFSYDPYKRDPELAMQRQRAIRTRRIRQEMLDELAKSVEGKKLNIFQKISYAIKKAKINRMVF